MKKLFSEKEEIDTEAFKIPEEESDDLFDTEVIVEKVEDPEAKELINKINNAPVLRSGKVNVACVNLRKEPKMSSPVVKVLPINTKLTIINDSGESNDFFEVKAPDDVHGFCKKQYVTVE